MKKLLSILIIVALILTFGAACGDDSTESGADNASQNAGLSTDKVSFIDANGEGIYSIIRPENSDYTSISTLLVKGIKEKLNISVKNSMDNNDGTDKYEILIGNTNRPETETVRQYMFNNGGGRYNDWIICSVGKKIVIYSQETESLRTAAQYFLDNFVKAEGVDGGINHFVKDDASKYSDITVNGEKIYNFTIIRPHFNFSYLAQTEIDSMIDEIYKKTGFMLSVKDDTYTTESDCEIVVGNTNRPGVEKIDDYDKFNVTVSGKKVYLNGGNTYSTAMAVSEFAKLISDGSVADADTVKGGSYKQTFAASYDNKTDYKLVWADDFDGTAVDTSKWDVCDEEYTSTDPATGKSGQNNKDAFRKPQNVKIEDGFFCSILTQDDENYYSGTIRTNSHLHYKYGYVETSSKMPQGSGFWNTLWMRYVDNNALIKPEIDVNESFGNSAFADPTIHVWPSAAAQKDGWVHREYDTGTTKVKYSIPSSEGTLKDAFHTYGFLWTEDYCAFTADGREYCRFDLNAVGFEDFKTAYTSTNVSMILSASCGFANCPLPQTATDEEWAKYNRYYVDYVHLYQLDDGGKSVLIADNPVKW